MNKFKVQEYMNYSTIIQHCVFQQWLKNLNQIIQTSSMNYGACDNKYILNS